MRLSTSILFALTSTAALGSRPGYEPNGLSRRQNGAYCNGYNINTGNRQAAVDNLLKICGNGWGIDAKALTAQVGDTFAYICNYSGSDWQCRDSDVRGVFDEILKECHEDGAGFYVHDDWRVNFGVAKTGEGIC